MEASIQSKALDEGCKIKYKGVAISVEEIKDYLKDNTDMSI